jgi:hypothetical protein
MPSSTFGNGLDFFRQIFRTKKEPAQAPATRTTKGNQQLTVLE